MNSAGRYRDLQQALQTAGTPGAGSPEQVAVTHGMTSDPDARLADNPQVSVISATEVWTRSPSERVDDGFITWGDWSNHDLRVKLNPPVTSGVRKLLIDGIEVPSNLTTEADGWLKFSLSSPPTGELAEPL